MIDKSRLRASHWRIPLVLVFAVLLTGVSTVSALPTENSHQFPVPPYDLSRPAPEMIHHAWRALPLTGQALHLAKIVDRTTGRVTIIATDESGRRVDYGALRAAERQVHLERYGKLSPELSEHLQEASGDKPALVTLWLDDEDTVVLPRRSTLGEMNTASRQAQRREQSSAEIGDLQAPVRIQIGALGGKVTYASRYAPLIIAELPPVAIDAIAARSDIAWISLVPPASEQKQMDSAAQTVRVDRVWDQGYSGSANELVAVLEAGDIDTGNQYLTVVGRRNGSLELPDEHKTMVAGVIASSHSTYSGVSPGVGLLDANYGYALGDAETIAAADWAISSGANVINVSMGAKTDGQMDLTARYLDYVVRKYYLSIIVAAGNTGNCGPENYVTSYALGYNVLSVASFNDADTAGWSDDTISDFSCYRDPESPHGDREKPEVAAVGESLTTTCSPFWTGNEICPVVSPGTSFAAPAVAGQSALLMQRASYLKEWPEAIRAIIMASAINNIEGESRLSDRDGAGGVDLYLSDTVTKNNWWTTANLSESSFSEDTYEISAYAAAGERVRVVIAWDSDPSSDYADDPLNADLDLFVYDPDGHFVSGASSASWDNSYEIVEFEAAKSGVYTWQVYRSRFDGTTEYLGAAWARVSPPSFTSLSVSSTKPDYLYNPGLEPGGGVVYLNTVLGEGGGQFLTVSADWASVAPRQSFDGATAFGDDPPADTDGSDGWTLEYGVESGSDTYGNVPVVVADGIERTTPAYVTFQVDNYDPAAPILSSPSHPDEDVWSQLDEVTIAWETPADVSGIAGYSHSHDHASYSLPDAVADTQGNSRTYYDLDDGTWFFHIRAVDHVSNWGSADHYRVRIDATAPPAPSISSSTHPVQGVCYPSDWAYFSWNRPDDLSGTAGFSYLLDQSPSTIPDSSSEGNVVSESFVGLANGYHYFHIRTVDNAGNWGATTHYQICVTVNYGPSIDGLPNQTTPEDTRRDNAIDLWSYAGDAESSDAELVFSIDNSPNASAGVTIDNDRYVDVDPTQDWCGSTTVRIRVTDPAGRWDTDEFDVTVTCLNDPPALDWTGESYFTDDGLHPEIGTSSTTFTYRIRYSDVEGNAPAYVRVHVENGGSPISGSPFLMSYVSGSYTDGATYTFSRLGLGESAGYSYYFSAQDSGGAPATATAELDAPDVNPTPPPTAPDGLVANTISQSKIGLSWNDNSDDETAFYFYRRPEGASDWEPAGIVSANATTVEDAGLACGTHYAYRIRAYRSGDGQFSDYSDTDDAWTALCDIQAPTDLSAITISQTQIDLLWTDNSDDETAFYVERSPDSSDWMDIETLAANSESYSDSGPGCNETYTYRIRAYRAADGATAYSNTDSSTTFACPPTNHAPTLSWTGESNYISDGLHPESGDTSTVFTYQVEYSDQDNDAPSYVRVQILEGGLEISGSPYFMSYASGEYPSGAIYEFQSVLPAGADYAYRFEAQDVHGASATPTSSQDAPDVVVLNAAPILSWTGESGYVADGLQPESGDMFTVFTYRVTYSDADGDAPAHVRVQIEKGGVAISGSPFPMEYAGGGYDSGAIYTLDVSGLALGSDYSYAFEAQDSAGNLATPTTDQGAPDVSAAPAPSAPTNLVAVAASQARINLSWQDNSGDETGFALERSPDGIGNWTTVHTTTADTTSHSDLGLSCNSSYYYRVRAYRADDGLSSAYGNQASTTTYACTPSPEIVFAADSISVTVHRGSLITLPLTLYNDGDAVLTYTLRPRRIAIISDDAQFDEDINSVPWDPIHDITQTLDSMGLAHDAVYDNWTGSEAVYTDDPAFLANYSTVVWHADPTPIGDNYDYESRLTTQAEHDTLEAYLQQGWSMMVTGDKVIERPEPGISNTLLMDLTRVVLTGSDYPNPGPYGGYQYIVRHAEHQIHRGPYWSYDEGYTNASSYFGLEYSDADLSRGAVSLIEWDNDTYADRLAVTELSSGGKVLFWSGDCRRWPWNDPWDLKISFENSLFWTEAPWLSYPSGDSTIPVSGEQVLELSFDAGPRTWVPDGLPEGAYNTVVVFQTNDPSQPWVQVPVTMTVVPNTAPAVSNAVASQRPGTGLIDISYDLSDPQQNLVDIAFQFWDGDSWVAATTVSGTGSVITGTELVGTWDASADFDGQYLKSARIRISADDGQTTHNIGYGESLEFILDTEAPTNSGLNSPVDGAIDVASAPNLMVNAAGGDLPPLQYRFVLDDNPAFDSGSGNLQDSGWQTDDLSWTPAALDNLTTYWWRVQVRDAYLNTAAFSSAYSFTTQSAAGNHSPVLSYTGEPGYEADGLDPEVGSPLTRFVFQIEYADQDGDPAEYVRAQVMKDGVETSASPFELEHVGGDHVSGAIYAGTVTGLEPGFGYTYLFEAADVKGAPTQSGESSGPDVSGGPPASETYGSTEIEMDAIFNGSSVGNIFQVSTPTHVSGFEMLLRDLSRCTMSWIVAEASSLPGDFTIISAQGGHDIAPDFGPFWHQSGEMDINLEPGQIYLFAMGFYSNCNIGAFRSGELGSEMPRDVSFGQLLQGNYLPISGDWYWGLPPDYPPSGTRYLNACAPEETCGPFYMRLYTGYPGDLQQVYLPIVLSE